MKTILYTEARNHLDKYINETNEQHDTILILGTKGRKDSVLISKEDYDNMIENLYIESNPEWIKSIHQGVADLDNGRYKKMNISEVLEEDSG